MKILELFESIAKKPTVFYGGRFQPMHLGHFGVYKNLVSKFGVDNVFIATVFGHRQQKAHDRGDYSTDPFTLQEKREIIATMYGIPNDHIIATLPFRPDITLVGRDPATNAVVLVSGEKDSYLSKESDIVKRYQDNILLEPRIDPETGQERVYTYVEKMQEKGMDATTFRNAIRNTDEESEMVEIFDNFFGNIQTNPNARNRIFGMVMRGIRRI